jgi:geranylgeranyl pyrophosphate synthase
MLLHDDVIGKGQIQHERPSVNSLCSNETAVLLGDFLLGRVFQMCAEFEPRVNEIIARAAVRICEGQLRQIAQRHKWHLSESEYIDVITEKSAVLFSTSCRLGAMLAQGTSEQIRLLAESGLNAGIAYQITDDLLNVIGNEDQTQTSAGKDVYGHEPNLAAIHLMGLLDENDREVIISSCPGRNDLKYDKDALAKMLKRYGSLEYGRARAKDFVTDSVAALEALKQSDARDALIETVKFMTCRII